MFIIFIILNTTIGVCVCVCVCVCIQASQIVPVVKNLPANAGDA